MAPPLFPHAVILVALLATAPAFAEGAAKRSADAGPVLPPEALGLPPAAEVPAQDETSSFSGFLHRTTVQPIVEFTRDSGGWIASGSNSAAAALQDASQWVAANATAMTDAARSTVEWIVSGSTAVANVAQDTGEWVAGKAIAVADAAQNTGDWIAQGSNATVMAATVVGDWAATGANAVTYAAQYPGEVVSSGSAAAVDAAHNAGQWIAGGAQTAVAATRDTGDWVIASTSAAVGATVGAASAVVSGVMALEDWSIGLVRRLENHLRSDGEFAALMRESGFVLSNIKVGVGIIPELDVEFRHERSLSPEEIKAFKAKVKDYVSKAPAPLGYFEKLVLRRLLKAGEMSGGMRVSELHIDLVPLPGLEVFFDPLRFEEEQNRMIAEAHSLAKSGEQALKSIEERIARIEALNAAAQARK